MLGLIANPAAGKDVRRLVAPGTIVTNEVKVGALAGVLTGARAAGERRVMYLPDPKQLVRRAAEMCGSDLELAPIAGPGTATWLDTMAAASALRDAGADAVVTLGGDGTNRAAVLGWRDIPVLPISAGTNNAFPSHLDGTVAGLAAGAVSSGRVGLGEVARQRPVVQVLGDAGVDDVAVVDAVALRAGPVGARALYDPGALQLAIVVGPQPTVTGLAGMAALFCPDAGPEDAVVMAFGAGPARTVVLAPGLLASVLARARVLAPGEVVSVKGPCLLAYDGERDRAVASGAVVDFQVRAEGPRVIDAGRALRAAALCDRPGAPLPDAELLTGGLKRGH